MKSFEHGKDDIDRLTKAFPGEQAFKFKETELSFYKKIIEKLTPVRAKDAKRMSKAYKYLEVNVSDITAQEYRPQATSREFEFSFDWDSDVVMILN